MESQIRYVSGALTIEYAADFDREELNTEWHQLVDAWETEAEELKVCACGPWVGATATPAS